MALIRSSSAELIAFFETGDIPTADNFTDLILSTAVYDGTLPLISSSAAGIISAGKLLVGNSVTSSLNPTLDQKYTLGTDSLRWKNVNTVTASFNRVSSSLFPEVNNIYDLGSGSLEWRELHVGTAFINTIDNNSAVFITTASFTHGVSSSILPDANNVYDLGSSTKEWKDLFIDGTANIDFASIDSASIGFVSSSLLPYADNIFNLGTAANSWKDLHVQGTATIGTLSLTALADNVKIPLISQSMTISGSILPSTDDVFDIGAPSQEFRDLHIDGTAFIDNISGISGSFTNIITTNLPASGNISSSGTITANAYVGLPVGIISSSLQNLGNITGSIISASGTIFGNDAQFGSSTVTINGPAGHITASGNISASGAIIAGTITTTGLTDNGTSTLANVDLTLASITSIDTVLTPINDGVLNIGSTSKKWNKLHINSITASGNISASGIIDASGFRVNGITLGTSPNTPWAAGISPSRIFYNAGNVGIGTSTPTSKLHVVGESKTDGFAGANTFGNSTSITVNTTVLTGYQSLLFVSNATPSITISSGVSYTINAGASVRIVNMDNIGNIPQTFYDA